ncbi:SCP2 sterol-binding domain-containing protein [Hoeflea prorocentri]|uniref:SCP2 sterol-binding domain-containing protein n=1 Tax=Hoeflea prorocentri TaxID=1922333 RepID=A0A9X3ZFV8_9HYPH|nr:SCP2 sterol-binding domain-containing protein [Hoeflea prorocentri]MCY6379170.1 SCP2 sterol-binding domain-containing protein [Hoeflea prorocentri]MDA5396971.1 SCP2 sterol-binding domain-containing protein [Hoeflea prorocentri]
MSVAEIAESIKDRVAAGSFDSVVKFNCGDDGVLVVDNQTVSTEDQEADCTIGISLEDLQSIVAGELDPTGAFMQGKLQIEGDMSVAMKLGQVL